MLELKVKLIRIANSLPKGDPNRRAIVHLLREDEAEVALRTAASKMPTVLVQGYDGFTDQIRDLSAAENLLKTLQAEIDAVAGDLLKRMKNAEKTYKDAVEAIKDAYKENLDAQGNVIIERKTALVEAQAKLKVVAVKGTLQSVQEQMVARVAGKYGDEIAKFIVTTNEALQEQHKTMRVSLDGFVLESREASASKTAARKQAFSIVGVLAKFRDYIKGGWDKIVSVAEAATDVILGRGAKVEKAHNEFMTALMTAVREHNEAEGIV